MENERLIQSKENKLKVSTQETLAVDPNMMTKEIFKLFGVIIITLILCRVVFALHKIPSSSMEPTIKTESLAVCWRLPYLVGDPTPQRGDIVSFYDPDSTVILIKRVIGIPGDVIEFDGEGNVYRNGEMLKEDYIAEQKSTFSNTPKYTVPEGTIFVMGDNRQHSADSRFKDTCYIPIQNIYSKELFSFYAPWLM